MFVFDADLKITDIIGWKKTKYVCALLIIGGCKMVQFVREKKLKPVVSRSVHGLDIPKIDSLFEDMKNGSQFGKLVVTLGQGGKSKL
jgi:D-arabinose 1-dehydrogenase-like Zn-dependent alcohol dehydrogenase